MKTPYLPLIIVNATFFVILLSERIADKSIDWFDLFWISFVIAAVMLAISFFNGFKDEDRRNWLIYAFASIGSIVLWFGLFLLLSKAGIF